MKKYFLTELMNKGFYSEVEYNRHEFSAPTYIVKVFKDGILFKTWDGGYFIGEENTSNSKQSMKKSFDEFVNSLYNQ